MTEVNDAEGAGNGISTRGTPPELETGVAGCTGRLDCAGTVANAELFQAELKGAGPVPGVIWDTFPCTLLDEDWL